MMELRTNDRFCGGGRSLESMDYDPSKNKNVVSNSPKKLSSTHDDDTLCNISVQLNWRPFRGLGITANDKPSPCFTNITLTPFTVTLLL